MGDVWVTRHDGHECVMWVTRHDGHEWVMWVTRYDLISHHRHSHVPLHTSHTRGYLQKHPLRQKPELLTLTFLRHGNVVRHLHHPPR